MRWWFPILVGGQLAVLLVKQYEWEFAWAETGAAATASVSFIFPVVTMSAGWVANRWHRSGPIFQLCSHSRLPGAPHLVQFSVTLGYVLLSYLVTVAVAWTKAVMASGWGVPWPGYLFLGAVFLAIGTGFGYATCVIIESRLAVPAVGLVAFAAWLMLGQRSPLTIQLLGGYSGEQLASGPVAWRVLLAVGLGALAVAVGISSDHWRSRPSAHAFSVVAAGLSIVAVVAMANAGPLREPRSADSVEPVCTETAVEICVWPDQAGFLPELAVYAERLELLDNAGLDVPDRYTERGLLGDDWSLHPSFHLQSATGEWIRASSLTFHIGLDLSSPEDCVTDAAMEYSEWSRDLQLVVAWPTFYVFGGTPPPGNGGGPEFDKERMSDLIALPEAEQIAWAVETTAKVTAERPCEDT